MDFCNYIILFGMYRKLKLVGTVAELRCGRSHTRGRMVLKMVAAPSKLCLMKTFMYISCVFLLLL